MIPGSRKCRKTDAGFLQFVLHPWCGLFSKRKKGSVFKKGYMNWWWCVIPSPCMHVSRLVLMDLD